MTLVTTYGIQVVLELGLILSAAIAFLIYRLAHALLGKTTLYLELATMVFLEVCIPFSSDWSTMHLVQTYIFTSVLGPSI